MSDELPCVREFGCADPNCGWCYWARGTQEGSRSQRGRALMATKNDPGQFDCYASAAPDEPMFILLARDPLAPILVRLWSELRGHLAGNPSKTAEARNVALAMERWRERTRSDDAEASTRNR